MARDKQEFIEHLNFLVHNASDDLVLIVLDVCPELTAEDLRSAHNRMLQALFTRGRIRVVQAFFSRFPQLIRLEDLRDQDCEILRTLAGHGHVDVLQFLFEQFPELNVTDIRAHDNHAIRCAASSSRSDVLKVLFSHFPELNVTDIRARDNAALRMTARYNRFTVIKWLLDTFSELDVQDVRAMDNEALRSAVRYGYHEIVKLLLDRFPELNMNDVRSDKNPAMRCACHFGKSGVLEILFQRFGSEMTEEELEWCGKTKDDLPKLKGWALCHMRGNKLIAWFASMDEALTSPLTARSDSYVVPMECPKDEGICTFSIHWQENDATMVAGLKHFQDAIAMWNTYPALQERLFIQRDQE